MAGLAKADLDDIHDAVRARKACLEHLEGQLEDIGAARDFDTPMLGGGWNFSAQTDYSKILLELGLDVVTRVLEETATKRNRDASCDPMKLESRNG